MTRRVTWRRIAATMLAAGVAAAILTSGGPATAGFYESRANCWVSGGKWICELRSDAGTGAVSHHREINGNEDQIRTWENTRRQVRFSRHTGNGIELHIGSWGRLYSGSHYLVCVVSPCPS